MNIDGMEAGRELDALVAEKVMEWQLLNSETYEPVISDSERKDASNNDGWHWEGRGGHSEAWEWRPSSKIHDAWEVVEKMHSPDASITLETGTRDGKSVWWCVFIIGDGRDDCAAGDTPQLAICRAALEVVNVG